MYELSTHIDIDAPADRVWTTLVDFDEYPDWNPFLRVRGRPNLGARLDVEIRPPDGRPARLRPTVTTCDRGREFSWLGHMYVPGLFDGTHRFVVEQRPDGRTRFHQSESFSGVLAGPILRLLADSVEAGFEEMNAALKARVEAPPADVDAGSAQGQADAAT